MARLAELGGVLTLVAYGFEVLFIPWYVTMIVIMYRSLRDRETGAVDRVTLWMIGLLVYGLLHTLLIIDDLLTLAHPPDRLAARIGLDLFRAWVVTMFMWHLRFKDLWDEWLNGRK